MGHSRGLAEKNPPVRRPQPSGPPVHRRRLTQFPSRRSRNCSTNASCPDTGSKRSFPMDFACTLLSVCKASARIGWLLLLWPTVSGLGRCLSTCKTAPLLGSHAHASAVRTSGMVISLEQLKVGGIPGSAQSLLRGTFTFRFQGAYSMYSISHPHATPISLDLLRTLWSEPGLRTPSSATFWVRGATRSRSLSRTSRTKTITLRDPLSSLVELLFPRRTLQPILWIGSAENPLCADPTRRPHELMRQC